MPDVFDKLNPPKGDVFDKLNPPQGDVFDKINPGGGGDVFDRLNPSGSKFFVNEEANIRGSQPNAMMESPVVQAQASGVKGVLKGAAAIAAGTEGILHAVNPVTVAGRISEAITGQTSPRSASLPRLLSPERIQAGAEALDTRIPTDDTTLNTVTEIGGRIVPSAAVIAATGGAALPAGAVGAASGFGNAEQEILARQQAGEEVGNANAQKIGSAIWEAILNITGGKLGKEIGRGLTRPAEKVIAGAGLGVAGGTVVQEGSNVIMDRPIGTGRSEAQIAGAVLGAGAAMGGGSFDDYYQARVRARPQDKPMLDASRLLYEEIRAEPKPTPSGPRVRRPSVKFTNEATAREELGVPPKGTIFEDDLDRAYKARARETHPDAGGSHDDFINTRQAYEHLQKRAKKRKPSGVVTPEQQTPPRQAPGPDVVPTEPIPRQGEVPAVPPRTVAPDIPGEDAAAMAFQSQVQQADVPIPRSYDSLQPGVVPPPAAAPTLPGGFRLGTENIFSEPELRALPTPKLLELANLYGVHFDSPSLTIPRIMEAQLRGELDHWTDSQIYWETRNRGLRAGKRADNIEALVFHMGVQGDKPGVHDAQEKAQVQEAPPEVLAGPPPAPQDTLPVAPAEPPAPVPQPEEPVVQTAPNTTQAPKVAPALPQEESLGGQSFPNRAYALNFLRNTGKNPEDFDIVRAPVDPSKPNQKWMVKEKPKAADVIPQEQKAILPQGIDQDFELRRHGLKFLETSGLDKKDWDITRSAPGAPWKITPKKHPKLVDEAAGTFTEDIADAKSQIKSAAQLRDALAKKFQDARKMTPEQRKDLIKQYAKAHQNLTELQSRHKDLQELNKPASQEELEQIKNVALSGAGNNESPQEVAVRWNDAVEKATPITPDHIMIDPYDEVGESYQLRLGRRSYAKQLTKGLEAALLTIQRVISTHLGDAVYEEGRLVGLTPWSGAYGVNLIPYSEIYLNPYAEVDHAIRWVMRERSDLDANRSKRMIAARAANNMVATMVHEAVHNNGFDDGDPRFEDTLQKVYRELYEDFNAIQEFLEPIVYRALYNHGDEGLIYEPRRIQDIIEARGGPRDVYTSGTPAGQDKGVATAKIEPGGAGEGRGLEEGVRGGRGGQAKGLATGAVGRRGGPRSGHIYIPGTEDLKQARDLFLKTVQDRMLPIQRMQESLGGPQRYNPLRGLRLVGAKAAEQIIREVDPVQEQIVERLKKARFKPEGDSFKIGDLPPLSEYLIARVAEDVNQRIAEVNPKLPDGGSGMTNKEARDIKALFANSPKRAAQYEKVAKLVFAMNRKTLDVMHQSGDISDDLYNELVSRGDYVPLRDDFEDDFGMKIGQGYSVRGMPFRPRTGRRSQADDPLTFSLVQAQMARYRAQKLKAMQDMGAYLRDNPDTDRWVFDQHPTQQVKIRPTVRYPKGRVVDVPDQSYLNKPNVVHYREGGKVRSIEFRGEDKELGVVLKNLKATEFGGFLKAMQAAATIFKLPRTTYSLGFFVTNSPRDVEGATLNIMAEQGLREGLKRANPRALVESFATMRHVLNDRNYKVGDKMADRARLFLAHGGKTTGFSMDDYQNTNIKIKNLTGRAHESRGRAGTRQFLESIKLGNEAAENMVRFLHFSKTLDKFGVPDDQLKPWMLDEAALAAKEVSVNFETHGDWGPMINLFYNFSGSATQGIARGAKAAFWSKYGRRIIGSLMAAGVAYGMFGRKLIGEDEYDKITEQEKQSNLILGRVGGTTVKIPMPHFWRAFFNAGRISGEYIGGGKDGKEALHATVMAMVDAANPLGSSGHLLGVLSPTITDPFVDIAINKNYMGSPITPEQAPFQAPVPRSQLAFESTSTGAKLAAQGIHRLFGGDGISPSALGGFEPAPTEIEYIANYLFGSTGREARQLLELGPRAYSGDISPRDIPVLNRYVGAVPEWAERTEFYKFSRQAREAVDLLDRYKKADPAKARLFASEHAKEIAFARWAQDKSEEFNVTRAAAQAATTARERRGYEQAGRELLAEFNQAYQAGDLPQREKFRNEIGDLEKDVREMREKYKQRGITNPDLYSLIGPRANRLTQLRDIQKDIDRVKESASDPAAQQRRIDAIVRSRYR